MLRPLSCLAFHLILSLSVGWFASSCHENKVKDSSIRSVEGSLDPNPGDKQSIKAQLQRYAGQTEFLNIASNAYLPIMAEASSDSAGGQQAPREVQDADLFKVGKAGSKLLYVLNPYRGLQVIDFSEGADKPKRLGRTDATGNEVIEMIFDETNMHIVVMERNWLPQGGGQGFLKVYSVADPSQPKLIQSVTLKGDIADSRQVGSIFYVASSRWANYQSIGGEGFITSYNLGADGLSEVTSYTLSLPVASLGNMNIVETLENGHTSYHLISVLSENRWGWWDRQSTIEVVDISDPKGSIKPVIMVATKGQLRERSGTHIKNGTLIAVSNSWTDSDVPTRRVTVESFVLPKADEPTIDQLEADFRKLWFEKKMKAKPSETNSEDYAETLATDSEYGLKGQFIKLSDGRITKALADHAITVGDTSGLNADLQDVRFVGDKVYVFWVPANQVDPLDVFDISAPQTQLKYLGRTLFEGWMERAVPFQYQGQDYVLGLGWIVPAVGVSPDRQAQVMIFKMPEPQDSGAPAQIVAQLTLGHSNLFASFNDTDKSITVRTTGDGQGLVIFPAFSWGPTAKSGGKIVSFDMSAQKDILKEGGFLQADANWLRRVFANPEIDKMHTLSDRALSTFDLNATNYGSADQVFDAISTLEMARDVRAYGKIGNYGLQFVESSSARYEDTYTELRVTSAEHADSEAILRKVKLDGRYDTHVVAKNGEIFVLTRKAVVSTTDGYETWKQKLILSRIRIQSDNGLLNTIDLNQVDWDEGTKAFGYWGLYAASRSQLLDRGNTLVVLQDDSLKLVSNGDQLQLKGQSDSSCLPIEKMNTEFKLLGDTFYINYSLEVKTGEKDYEGVLLSRAFLAPLNSAYAVDCEKAINIPGKAIRFDGSQLVTDDQRFLGFDVTSPIVYPVDNVAPMSNSLNGLIYAPQRWPNSARVLNGLIITSGKAELKDLYSLSGAQGEIVNSSSIYALEQAQQWAPRYLSSIRFGGERFERKAYGLPAAQDENSWPQLGAVIGKETPTHFLIQDGRRATLYRIEGDELRPQSVQVVQQNDFGEVAKDFLVPEWIDPLSKDQRIVYDAERGRLAIAQGLYGVLDIQIAK